MLIVKNFWGTTSTDKAINKADSITINSSSSNSYLQLRNSGTSNNAIIGLVGDNLININYKIQNTSAGDVLTCDNSGNVVVAGTLNSGNLTCGTINSGSISSSGRIGGDYLVNDTSVYNSGSNCNFKIQGSSVIRRFETQTGGSFYLWDESNNSHFISALTNKFALKIQ